MKKIGFFTGGYSYVITFLIPIIIKLQKKFNVVLVGNFSEEEVELIRKQVDVEIVRFSFGKKHQLISHCKSIIKLYFMMRQKKFNAVITFSQVTGILSNIIVRFCKAPIMIHMFTGQGWVTYSFFKKLMYKYSDILLAKICPNILTDSISQANFLHQSQVVKQNKNIETLGVGSICGVNTDYYKMDDDERQHLIATYNFQNKMILAYHGRINKDKGVLLLLNCFSELAIKYPNLCLIIMSRNIPSKWKKIIHSFNKNNIFLFNDSILSIQQFLSLSDIYCFPSYREGFGMSVIEASSMALPIVCSNIYGLENTCINNKTGLKFEPGVLSDFKLKIEILINSKKDRVRLGNFGREYVIQNFEQHFVLNEWENYFNRKLNN